jgi:7-cyano-7-deazaguanine synthase
MPDEPLAILISGGLDSAILLGVALRRHRAVQPIFVRFGLFWEAVEQRYLECYLDALRCPTLRPLVVLDQPVADIYDSHWSITGDGVPDAAAPDEDVFLPGRNVLLLAKPLLWCHRNHVPAIALGSLQSNPFPDATPRFFRGIEDVVNQAVGGRVKVELPFGGMCKTPVMELGRDLPLQYTFSCIRPTGGLHCGRCNKCAERQRAFAEAALVDPTKYAFAR